MMTVSTFVKWLSLAAICFHLYSCQVMEDFDGAEQKDSSSLKIETRSSETNQVLYPLFLYAFNEKEECVASQKIMESDERMELVLPKGNYRVVAISCRSDCYHIPENPSLEDVVTMGDSGDLPLMMGAEDIKVDGKEEISVEIILSYVVSGVHVTLKNVPQDVSKVSFKLFPLYSSISFAGKYQGNSKNVTALCQLVEEQIWASDTLYVFPGCESNVQFTIVLEKKDGTQNKYEYICPERPKAGRFFNITGNYLGGISVTGSVISGKWDGTDDVSFEFGEFGQSGGESSGETSVSLPEIGTIWNGAIVADVVEVDSIEADILLLSLDEWEATTSQVDAIMDGYGVNDMMQWRLPSHEEAQLFRNRFCGEARISLNARIAEYDDSLYGIDGEERYLCDKSGEFYSFVFSTGKAISQAGTQRSYLVRLVKSCRIRAE